MADRKQAVVDAIAARGRPHTPTPMPWADGMVSRGNVDMTTRPQVQNPDGSVSTIQSMSYANNAGQEVLIPTISNEGTHMSPHEAMQYWGTRGQNMGVFDDPLSADAYAQQLHEAQAKYFGM